MVNGVGMDSPSPPPLCSAAATRHLAAPRAHAPRRPGGRLFRPLYLGCNLGTLRTPRRAYADHLGGRRLDASTGRLTVRRPHFTCCRSESRRRSASESAQLTQFRFSCIRESDPAQSAAHALSLAYTHTHTHPHTHTHTWRVREVPCIRGSPQKSAGR